MMVLFLITEESQEDEVDNIQKLPDLADSVSEMVSGPHINTHIKLQVCLKGPM